MHPGQRDVAQHHRRRDLTPLHTGNRNQYGAQVSGGTRDRSLLRRAAICQNEIGPIQACRTFELRASTRCSTSIRDEWMHPEALQGQKRPREHQCGAELEARPRGHGGLLRRSISASRETDNNFNSVFYSVDDEPRLRRRRTSATTAVGLARRRICTATTRSCLATPSSALTPEDVDRLIGKRQCAVAAVDLDAEHGNGRSRSRQPRTATAVPVQRMPVLHARAVSVRYRPSPPRSQLLIDARQHAAWQATQWLNLKTTVGADYTNQEIDSAARSGHEASAGRADGPKAAVTSAARDSSAARQDARLLRRRSRRASRSAVPHGRRFAPTRTARSARTSSSVMYPKASLSWILSDESFFPKPTG